MRKYLNWKAYFVFIALSIVSATLYYTNQLAGKLADEEQKKIETFVEGLKVSSQTSDATASEYILKLTVQNTNIPLILTDEQNNVIDYKNLDSNLVAKNKNYIINKIEDFKSQHTPLVVDFESGKQKVYYGDSYLLRQLKYFPYVQLTIILLFLLVIIIAIQAAHRSLQNQVWVGLSKETAHQLGTPLSSIEGWLELLKDSETNKEAVAEMQNDLERLKLVADRFSKVGSAPQMEEDDLMHRINNMVAYMEKRAPKKVSFSIQANEPEVPVYISGALFDWVLENLMRNALDAMDGKGAIDIRVMNHPQQVRIDVSDTGKGIPKHLVKKIFSPGFTTKKRGWGLGLSLSRRIIEQYHHGSLFVKQTELGKGTTFRIILRR